MWGWLFDSSVGDSGDGDSVGDYWFVYCLEWGLFWDWCVFGDHDWSDEC